MRMNPVSKQWYAAVVQKFYKSTKDIKVFYVCLSSFLKQKTSMHIGEEQEKKKQACYYKEEKNQVQFILILKWL